MTRKLTINITDKTDAALESLHAASGINTTDAVNKGVQVYAWLQSEIDAGSMVQVVSRHGGITNVKLF